MKIKRYFLFKYILYTLLFNKKRKAIYKRKLQMLKDNKIIAPYKILKHINIIAGKNNTIIIPDTVRGFVSIEVFGNNNKVCLENYIFSRHLNIIIGQNHKNFGPVHDCEVNIGEHTSFESAEITIKNSNAKLNIGKNCTFAFGTVLYHTDSHPVFDLDTKKIANKVKTMHIGNHVWVGANTTILKNTFIADDCIVGWGSVVSGKFEQQHAAICGNPAKVVKTNITWDNDGSKGYVQNV